MESWEEFAKAAERMYSQSPWKVPEVSGVHARVLFFMVCCVDPYGVCVMCRLDSTRLISCRT